MTAVLSAAGGDAQWSTDPGVNNPVAVAPHTQSPVLTVRDLAGGVIVFWRSRRFDAGTSTFVHDLYAQRISANGVTLWAAGGVRLATGTVSGESTPSAPVFAASRTSGAGTAVVAWRDVRGGPDGDIYAQKVNGNGIPQWPVGGAPVVVATGVQRAPAIASDGSGGAVFAWEDQRFGNSDIYAQRLTASGLSLWTAGGVAVCGAAQEQVEPQMDGQYFLTWTDNRGADADIYAQRLDEFGGPQWTLDGVAVSSAPGAQRRPRIAIFSFNSPAVVWEDDRTGDPDIYAQRLDGAGLPQWTTDGVPIGVGPNASAPAILGFGGSAVVAWSDERNGTGNADIFAQRLDASGAPLWTPNGMTVSAAGGNQTSPVIADASPAFVVAWADGRSDESDVFAQKLDQTGSALWNANGAPVSMAANAQRGPSIVLSVLGVIIAWEDGRNPANDLDVYASFVNEQGGLPVRLQSFTIE